MRWSTKRTPTTIYPISATKIGYELEFPIQFVKANELWNNEERMHFKDASIGKVNCFIMTLVPYALINIYFCSNRFYFGINVLFNDMWLSAERGTPINCTLTIRSKTAGGAYATVAQCKRSARRCHNVYSRYI